MLIGSFCWVENRLERGKDSKNFLKGGNGLDEGRSGEGWKNALDSDIF